MFKNSKKSYNTYLFLSPLYTEMLDIGITFKNSWFTNKLIVQKELYVCLVFH